MREFSTAVVAMLCLSAGIRAEFSFQYDESQRRWTLTNQLVQASLRLTTEGFFEFERFHDLRNGVSWAAPASGGKCPIRLSVDQQVYGPGTPFALVSQSADAIPGQGYRQSITLQDELGIGQVLFEAEMYENQPVVRVAASFRNLRANAVRVTEAEMLHLRFAVPGASYRAFRVNQWAGGGLYGNFEPTAQILQAGDPFTVYSGATATQCAWLALRDAGNRGLFAGWEFDGRGLASVEHRPAEGVLELSFAVLDQSRAIAPDEGFQIPGVFVGTYRGDWDEAAYRTQRFTEQALAMPEQDSQFPYVAWNSWGYQTNIDEATLRRNAQIAATLGVELFVVDLGWARQIGDWYADRAKFPSGLRALSDYVHRLGMKFGLHFALLEGSRSAPVLQANPDWAASVNENYFGAVSLCPAHEPVRQWVISQALRIIDEYGVDWIVQDGENMVKRCNKTTHTHDPEDSNYSNAVDGIDYIVSEVLRQRPNVRWENCEDGGSMMSYGMVRRYSTSIAADNSDALTTRQSIFGTTYPFPPRYSSRYMPDESLSPYVTRSYMFGGPWIFMNRLVKVSSRDLQFAASEIRLFKSLRERIRTDKVFHLTARPAPGHIDAIESYSRESGSAVIFVYRTASAASHYVLRPRGLEAGRTYTVRLEGGPELLSARGSQLMRDGVGVDLTDEYSAEIVYIEPLP